MLSSYAIFGENEVISHCFIDFTPPSHYFINWVNSFRDGLLPQATETDRQQKRFFKFMRELLNIGFGHTVISSRIVAIVSPKSAPIKRLKEEARHSGKLVDATSGRQTRAVIVTDSGHVVLSAVMPNTLLMRLAYREGEEPYRPELQDDEEKK